MVKLVSLPQARPPYAPFVDRNIIPGGKPVWIDNKETQQRLLKARGLRIAEPLPKPYQEWLNEKRSKYKEARARRGTTKNVKLEPRPKEAYPSPYLGDAQLASDIKAAQKEISSAVTNTA